MPDECDIILKQQSMQQSHQDETTNEEILHAVKDFADDVQKQFDEVRTRLTKVEATMVTKDYLDEKLFDLRGDFVILMRKEDAKVETLVDVLRQRKVISDQEAEKVLGSGPFPA